MKRTGITRWIAGTTILGLTAAFAQGGLVFTNLLFFDGTNGSNPKAELIQGVDGRLFGTVVKGGSNGFGAVFALAKDGSGFTNLYSFSGAGDGANPSAGLIADGDGGFYGTTYSGGAQGAGTVFRITPDGALTTIATLSTNLGSNPDSRLVLASDGSLYGTADMQGASSVPTYPGAFGYGSVFRVTTGGEIEAEALFLSTNGDSPKGAVIQAADGDFYGTTQWGGQNLNGPYKLGYGTIYRLAGGTLTTLYQFTGGVDGGWPYAGLVQGRDGSFYGAAFDGGAAFFGYGSIFRITAQGQFSKLHSFTSNDGANPYGSLIQASDGNLYGTTYAGGPLNAGTIFQITTNGAFMGLHAFSVGDGLYPISRLVQADDGNFYGTTASGGAYTNGTIFRLSVPLAPVIERIAWTNGAVACTWKSVASQTYQLEYTTNLTSPDWTTVGQPATASSGLMSAVDSALSEQPRWYRVVLFP